MSYTKSYYRRFIVSNSQLLMSYTKKSDYRRFIVSTTHNYMSYTKKSDL